MKKIANGVIVVVLTLSILFSFSACQQSDKKGSGVRNDKQTGEGVTSQKMPEKLDNPNVSILLWGPQPVEDLADDFKVFEEKYGGKVNMTAVEGSVYENKVIASMAAGEPFDILKLFEKDLPKYQIKGLIQPIDQYFDLQDPLWEEGMDFMNQNRYKGKLYGVSSGTESFFIIYNKTLFQNNGLKTPTEFYKEGNWNWNMLKELGIKLTQDTDGDGAIDQWGFFPNGSFIEHIILANGADLVNFPENGSIEHNLNDPKVIEALQFYQDGHIKDKFIPITLPSWQEQFRMGKLAMYYDRPMAAVMLVIKDMKDEWDIAPFPNGPSGEKGISPATGSMWGIGNGAENPYGAATLITLMVRLGGERSRNRLQESYSAEQISLIQAHQSKIIVGKFKGIGDFQKKFRQLLLDIRKGTPVSSAIAKHSPVLQQEIDMILKDQ